MQKSAEKHLIKRLEEFISVCGRDSENLLRILNIRAGKSLFIENQLTERGCEYVCDRIDVEDCEVSHKAVGNCCQYSVESMSGVATEGYEAAFTNFLLEHVENLKEASREIFRCLEKAGIFIASIANPIAPEVWLSRWTPLWFHRAIRDGEAWKTHYASNSIEDLIITFESAGFRTLDVKYYSFIEAYLYRFYLLGALGRLYDRISNFLGIKRLMSNVCITFEKI